eukprot:3509641-Pleurochrysis_carterae.AAC.1
MAFLDKNLELYDSSRSKARPAPGACTAYYQATSSLLVKLALVSGQHGPRRTPKTAMTSIVKRGRLEIVVKADLAFSTAVKDVTNAVVNGKEDGRRQTVTLINSAVAVLTKKAASLALTVIHHESSSRTRNRRGGARPTMIMRLK